MTKSTLYETFNCTHLDSIENAVEKYSMSIINSLLDKETETLRQTLSQIESFREEVEFEDSIEQNKSYYYGFLSGLQQIGYIFDAEEEANSISNYAAMKDENIKSMLLYLNEHDYALQKDLAAHLKMSTSRFSNFMLQKGVRQANAVKKSKIGNTSIYELNTNGRRIINEILGKNVLHDYTSTKRLLAHIIRSIQKEEKVTSGTIEEFGDEIKNQLIELQLELDYMNNKAERTEYIIISTMSHNNYSITYPNRTTVTKNLEGLLEYKEQLPYLLESLS